MIRGNYDKDKSHFLENKKATFPHEELRIQKMITKTNDPKKNTTRTEVIFLEIDCDLKLSPDEDDFQKRLIGILTQVQVAKEI